MKGFFEGFDFEKELSLKLKAQKKLLAAKNSPTADNNGQYQRWVNPVLTAAHFPLEWRYDLDRKTNPFFMERLGINAVFNSGAIFFNDKVMLVARVESVDRKSFFAVAESDNGVDNFRFTRLVDFHACDGEETNIYDIRLTLHQDGWIYGLFCSESKDKTTSDMSAAVAKAGLVRTKDMTNFERLPNLTTKSPQQRNVVLHPEFVDGKYMFYTRPQDGFIEAGSGGGICTGFCSDINNPVIAEEKLLDPRIYHTITEGKNGAGAVPIKTERGWIHIAHGVRNTAAGLRYVIYVFVTGLENPAKVIASPGGYFIAPEGTERVGDVSNVVFTNGAIVKDGRVYIYYGGSDTRLYVATTTLERLVDYAFNTPADGLISAKNMQERKNLAEKNKKLMR